MVGWIICGSIVLFFILLFVLLFTVHAQLIIDLKDEIAIIVKVFGIPIQLLPKKKKKYNLRRYTLKKIRRREARAAKRKAKADLRKKKRRQEKSTLTKEQKRAIKKQQLADLPPLTDLIPLTARVVKLFFSRFFGKLHISLARVHIKVGGGDAAMIAVTYGIMTNAVGLLVKALQKFCDVDSLDKADIVVEPDFTSDRIKYDCHIVFRLSLGNVVWAAIKAAWKFLVGYLKIRPETPAGKSSGDKSSKKKSSHNGSSKNKSTKGQGGKGQPTEATTAEGEASNASPPTIESPSNLGGIPLPPKPPSPPMPW